MQQAGDLAAAAGPVEQLSGSMKSRRYSHEQIREILVRAQSEGNVRAVCREVGITEQTLYRWRKKFPSHQSDAQRIEALRKENQALKEIVAELWMALREASRT